MYFWSEDIIEDIFQNMLEFHSKINISLNPERGLGILGEMKIILLVDYTVDRETLV